MLARSVKGLLGNHEAPSRCPAPCKKLGMVMHVCIPSAREVEIPGAQWPGSLVHLRSSRAISKELDGVPNDDSKGGPMTSTHMYIHTKNEQNIPSNKQTAKLQLVAGIFMR